MSRKRENLLFFSSVKRAESFVECVCRLRQKSTTFENLFPCCRGSRCGSGSVAILVLPALGSPMPQVLCGPNAWACSVANNAVFFVQCAVPSPHDPLERHNRLAFQPHASTLNNWFWPGPTEPHWGPGPGVPATIRRFAQPSTKFMRCKASGASPLPGSQRPMSNKQEER